MTDQSQQEFSIDEVMAQAAARFGGGDYQTAKQEEEPQDPAPVEPVEPAPVEPQDPAPVEKTEPAAPVESAPTEPAAPVIDPMLKALLEANNPAPVEPVATNDTSDKPVEKTPENVQEPVKVEQPQNPAQGQIKTIQPNDLLTDGARKFLQEYKDLDEQSFNVMDLMAEAHSKAQVHNLEQAVVQVVQQLQGQIAQQNQIINELKNQLAGVHTKVTAPTLDDDITAMKADPLVAAYLPYMQNILNGQDINAKMQLVNTWKSSKSTTNSVQPAAPVTQAPVVERRTSSVSAAAEATAALANKTQGSMVQPSDPIEEGMRLAQERFGLNRK